MNNNLKILMAILTGVLVILAACVNSSEESNAKGNDRSADNNLTQNGNGAGSNKNKEESSLKNMDGTQVNDQEDTSKNTPTNSRDGKSLTSSNDDSEDTEKRKKKYLKKLNELEDLDKNTEVKSTTLDMERQEAERYKNWDKELNEIYGVLKKQLSIEQMDKLRVEQRNWVENRDEAAKEASLRYEGGSTESLEYVATQASLTKERCYELVANHMR